jgi:hypothetical protein
MLSDGTGIALATFGPRSWPAKIHLPWLASPALSNRLAKMFSAPKLVSGATLDVSSYQVAHGTVRPAPAKSIDGASPS